jgi:hypothetical protein
MKTNLFLLINELINWKANFKSMLIIFWVLSSIIIGRPAADGGGGGL